MSSPIGHVLGISHIVVGAAAIIAPINATKAFRIVPAASTVFISRAFGSRDLVTGLAIQMYDRGSAENRVAVLACGIIHAIDIVGALVSYAEGNLPFEALVLANGIDVLLVGMCWFQLKS